MKITLLLLLSLGVFTTADETPEFANVKNIKMGDLGSMEGMEGMQDIDFSNFPGNMGGMKGDAPPPPLDVDPEETVTEGQEDPLHNFSDSELTSMDKTHEDHDFQADVFKVMNILTHSLYSHREIVLRELISNAVDALDKVRYLHLTEQIEEGNLEIKVRADPEANTLTITDTGVGMTKEMLIKNLGTVARSGTTSFIKESEEHSKDAAVDLIGQFGVGFYSSFLIADEVIVVSKNDGGDQHIWRSKADGAFTVAADPRGNTMLRGSSIILKLKDDCPEFTQEHYLTTTIKRYSEFMTHPIKLYTKKEEDREEPIEEEASEEKEEEKEKKEEDEDEDGLYDNDLEISDDDDEDAEKKPKTKTVRHVTYEWSHLNTQPPIWTRSRSNVSDEEYKSFYHALTHNDKEDPLTQIHFKAEGEIEFKSIMFIPERAPSGVYEDYYSKKSEIRVYVRKVLVNDKFEDFVPSYLHFIRGLVDSNDLPLNVNREHLQKSKVMKVISKKLTRKALEMIRKMADASEPESKDDEDEEEEAVDELKDGEIGEEKAKADKAAKEAEKKKYFKFWAAFGKSVKMGLLEEDKRNQSILKKLLRFHSSKGEKNPISLDTYVSRMSDKQKGIFYISGESIEAVEDSPSLEKVKKAGYEVLYFVDPLDEYILRQLHEYENVKLYSVTKENLELHDVTDAERSHWEDVQKDYETTTKWFKSLMKGRVNKVQVSKRLDESPCILVSSQYGPSVNMERIQKSQPFARKDEQLLAKKVLELNYRHPIVQELKSRIEALDEDADVPEDLKDYAEMLYDSALLSGGYTHDDAAAFANRINKMLKTGLNVAPDAKVDPEKEFADEEEEEVQEDEEAEEGESEEGDAQPDADATTTEKEDAEAGHSEL